MAAFNTSGRLNRFDLYPCCDRPKGHEGLLPTTKIAGMWMGERRPPRKGEWYISGAIPECYRAPNDLTTPHAIAVLVRTEKVTMYNVYVFEGEGGTPMETNVPRLAGSAEMCANLGIDDPMGKI